MYDLVVGKSDLLLHSRFSTEQVSMSNNPCTTRNFDNGFLFATNHPFSVFKRNCATCRMHSGTHTPRMQLNAQLSELLYGGGRMSVDEYSVLAGALYCYDIA